MWLPSNIILNEGEEFRAYETGTDEVVARLRLTGRGHYSPAIPPRVRELMRTVVPTGSSRAT
jgi:hypothetical protein